MSLSNSPDTCKLFLDFNILLTAWGHTRTKQMTGWKRKEVTVTRQVMLTLILYCAAYCPQPLTPNNTHHQPLANKMVGKCFQLFMSQTISSAKLKQQSPRNQTKESWLLTDLSHKSNQLPKQRNKQQQNQLTMMIEGSCHCQTRGSRSHLALGAGGAPSPSPPPATGKQGAVSCGCGGEIHAEEQGWVAVVVVVVVTVAEGCCAGGWTAETATGQRLCLCWRMLLVTHLLNRHALHYQLTNAHFATI